MAKKYIDADLLRKEIEKRLKNIRDYMRGTGMRYKGPKYFKAQGKESAYDALLSIIVSLQQEQSEQPTRGYDEAYLNDCIAKAKKSWEGVDVDKFMDEIRGREPDKSLEEEYKDYVENDPVYSKLVNRNAGLGIARHFAEWGADHLRDSTKMVDEDLEEAVEEFSKTYMTTGEMTWKDDIRTSFIAGAKWQEKHDEETIKTAEDHAFLAGADWQKEQDEKEQADLFTIVALDAAQRAKEQMMKGAVEGEVVDSGFDDGTAILKAIVPDRRYDSGDKVKVIVIKED